AGALPPNPPKLGMICTPGTVAGATHTFNLVANTGYIQTPDGNSVLMWSYANADSPDNGSFQSPGPVLCVTQGQTVVVNLHNTLSEASSIVFPGQTGVAASGGSAGLMTTEAATNGNVTYTFTAGSPGTYLYESGSDISKQIEMGLYGALIVRPTIGANYAYDASTRFDPTREYMQLLSEFDPDLHVAVENNTPYDFNKVRNRYFAINGRDFPDTVQDNGVSWLPNQPYGALVRIQPTSASNPYPALIRMLNVGAVNHPFHPHGNHLREIAQDGRLMVSPGGASASTERFGETIGSGQTRDYLLRWDDADHWGPNPTDTPLPPQPNYRNLFFKGGVTWYAGNPYLGYKGTLPTGTASLNVCGEWYFPLHSHALNEFSNFDAGFGGMGTLLRVDPPGGCFTFPTAAKITTRTLAGGSYTNLAVDDTAYYQVNSSTTGTPRTTDWYGQFGGVPAGATNLAVTYKGHISLNATGTAQTLSAWNWVTNAWVAVAGPNTVGTADITQGPATIPGSAANFIGTGSNAGQVRVRVLTTRSAATNFVTSGNLMKLVYDAP
ncbi:MAG: multicopper oxidase domain-containing protein, partial [Mycobacteriales bacterium]